MRENISFNTSYITINHRCGRMEALLSRSFNTSYITINQKTGLDYFSLDVFQYILYYY